ncbi:LysR family transcriptional regulator [Paraburkholderia sp. A1RI_3L]|uniref:LysR family transcriptional regulator n=1 Tax=Paraburkholderia TaxID=1822464 RepID=UPI00240883A7|nr:LysR family transcriptional regulator [Paraburkholderia sp. SUR17]WEY41597.1 LysR family transcriptional regulator [Paraburkholderia sp. SUR17]
MDRLQAMEIFTRVVESKSFSKAADMLDLPRGTVSNLIRSLEEHVGVRLLNRTTRSVNVTEDGALYYERCVRILAEISDAESSLSNKRSSPTGTVRVDTSGTIARTLLIPALGQFYRAYPHINVRLGLSDRNIDMIQDGVDCVIRMGSLEESSLVARRIGNARMVVCASPAYLEEYGTPATLEDLAQHRAVNYISSSTGRTFPFEFLKNPKDLNAPETITVQMESLLAVNDGSAYIAAGVEGYGIIQPSRFMVTELLAQGHLREILTDYRCPSTPLSILYPHRQNLNSRIRAFTEWVTDLAHAHPDLRT